MDRLPLPPDLPYCVFDIETVPMPGCEHYLDLVGIEAPKNYKDQAKIDAYIENEKRDKVNRAGLDMDLCEIAAIAWLDEHNTGGILLRGLEPEASMLRKFWQATAGKRLVCFNGFHFDLPVLLRRSLYLNVAHPPIRLDRYRADGVTVLDVADVLSFGRRESLRSLSFYCKRFGVAHDDSVKGSDIARLVADADWKAVSAHVYADVQATKDLAMRIGLVRQPQLSEVAI